MRYRVRNYCDNVAHKVYRYTTQSTLNPSWIHPDDAGHSGDVRDFTVLGYVELGKSVKSRYDPTPGLPGSPTDGDSYISTATANGWTVDYLYIYDGSAWEEEIPGEGFVVWVDDEDHNFAYDGSAWYKSLELPLDGNLVFSHTPDYNGTLSLLGWNRQTDAAASLTTAAPVTASIPGYHSHFVIDVSSASGLPFTVRVTGTSVDESTGTETPADTEDISVTANGYYQSVKSWVDAPQFSIVEASKSCTIDIYRVTYWDRGNKEFTITGCRMEWEPSVSSWSIQLKIEKVNEDGSIAVIVDVTFANTDTPPRAGTDDPGKYKRLDFNTFVDGIAKQGLLVSVTQTAIKYFLLEVAYTK